MPMISKSSAHLSIEMQKIEEESPEGHTSDYDLTQKKSSGEDMNSADPQIKSKTLKAESPTKLGMNFQINVQNTALINPTSDPKTIAIDQRQSSIFDQQNVIDSKDAQLNKVGSQQEGNPDIESYVNIMTAKSSQIEGDIESIRTEMKKLDTKQAQLVPKLDLSPAHQAQIKEFEERKQKVNRLLDELSMK